MLRSGRSVFAWLGATLVLAACGGSKPAGAPSSQVAVKVNGDEISVHQVNAQLSRLNNVPAEQRDAARKQVAELLVDQQLLIQQAVARKLDRDPDVLTALEASRHQILAQAYVQKSLAAQAKPSEDEVRAYVKENPALFAERRIFRLQEINTSLPVARAGELEALVEKAKDLKDVATWLQAQGAQVALSVAVRGAEQLPLGALPRIAAMKDGQIGAFVNDGRVTVLQVMASQPQPMAEKDAAPFVEQFLANRKRDELARSELKKLRDAAKIEFVGDFAKSAAAPAATKVEAARTDAPKVEAVKAPASVTGAATAVDQGVKGLR